MSKHRSGVDTTKRTDTEQAQRRMDELFRALIENASDVITILDAEGIIRYQSPSVERVLGYKPHELIGTHIAELLHPDDLSKSLESYAAMKAGVRSGTPETCQITEERLRHKDGSWRILEGIAKVLDTPSGAGIVINSRDITERKRTEEQIESLSRFPAENPNPLLRFQRDGTLIYANPSARPLLQLCGCEVGQRMPADWARLVADSVASGARKEVEIACDQRVYSFVFAPIQTAGYVNAYGHDITERRRAEEGLKKSAQLLRDVGEMAKVGVWELDLSTKEVSWTEEVGRTHGVGPGYKPKLEEAMNFYAPESRPALEEVLKKAAETGEPYDLESLFIPSGSKDKIWVRSLGRAVYSGGRIVKLAGTFQNIDKYKRAEEALRQSEENFEALAESASEGILIATGEEGRHVYANRRAVEITGYPIEELLKTCMRDLAHPEELPKIAERYKERLEGLEVPNHYETAFLNKDGVKVPIEISPSRTIWQNQLADMVMFRDITERKRAEEAVRRASAYNRSLIEASLDPLVTIAPDGKITDVNNTTEKVTGLSRQQLIGTDFSDYFTDSGKARAGYEQVFREGLVQNYELEIRHRDGHVTPVLYNASVYRDEAGDVIGVFAAARDITERKRAEEALRESEERFRSLVENATVGIYRTTPDGHILMANPALVRMLGFDSFEELAARNLECEGFESSYPRSVFRERIEREGQVIGLEAAWIRHDGSVIFVRESAKAVRADAGRVLYYDGIIEDITTRRHAEEAVRRAGAYNRSLIEASLDPLVTIAPDGKITDANNTTEKVTGRSRQQLMGTDFADYFTDPGKARAGYEQVFREGLVQDYELEIRRRDGHVTPVLYNASVYRDEAGDVIGVFAAARDISERKRAEEKIRKLNEELDERVRRHTAELEATNKDLEAFTYSVSHDLRGPLRHIDGFSKLLFEEYSADLPEEARRHLSRIRDGTRRMGMMVDDLLNLTRVGRKELSMQLTGLSSLLEEALGDLQPETAGREIEWRIGKLPFVECDPGLVKQVFANLLSNALKFTRLRERAVIEVGETTQDGRPVIFVRDNGVGFSMKYVDKLFGIFQRLHRPEDFEGAGIGLATVQRIVRKHGGRVWAEGELNKGATFYFTLEAVQSRPGESNSLPRGAA